WLIIRRAGQAQRKLERKRATPRPVTLHLRLPHSGQAPANQGKDASGLTHRATAAVAAPMSRKGKASTAASGMSRTFNQVGVVGAVPDVEVEAEVGVEPLVVQAVVRDGVENPPRPGAHEPRR